MTRKHRQPETTALTVLEPTGTELALPAELLGKARHYASKSRSERTLKEYAKWWKKFQRWCDANGREALPANVPTLGAYMTWLADGQDKATPLATSSIYVALSAIKFRHKSKHSPLDMEHPDLQNIWGGIRREIALKRTKRRVKPLMFAQLREILEALRPEVVREARDAAVLALACGAGLRRSELVGLDWHQLGTVEDKGRLGFLKIDDEGIAIKLMRSKASQETAEDIIIPRDFAPILCKAMETWVQVGSVQKGSPLFRGVRGRGWSINPQSGYIGVTWSETQRKWRAQAKVNGEAKHLGFFPEPEEAHLAYCKATRQKPQKPNADAVKAARMDAGVVADIVKRRIQQYLEAQNKKGSRATKRSKEEINALVAEYSGHSPRAGCVTSMAENGVPTHQIQSISRHKSAEMVAGYIRPMDKRKNWALKGVAF